MSHEQIVDAVRTALAAADPADPIVSVELVPLSGRRVPVVVPAELAPEPPVRHTPDGRWWRWRGQEYEFTATQARCVLCLWHARRNGIPKMSGRDILVSANSSRDRLDHVFRDRHGGMHRAWGAMIVSCGCGMYGLACGGEVGEEGKG